MLEVIFVVAVIVLVYLLCSKKERPRKSRRGDPVLEVSVLEIDEDLQSASMDEIIDSIRSDDTRPNPTFNLQNETSPEYKVATMESFLLSGNTLEDQLNRGPVQIPNLDKFHPGKYPANNVILTGFTGVSRNKSYNTPPDTSRKLSSTHDRTNISGMADASGQVPHTPSGASVAQPNTSNVMQRATDPENQYGDLDSPKYADAYHFLGNQDTQIPGVQDWNLGGKFQTSTQQKVYEQLAASGYSPEQKNMGRIGPAAMLKNKISNQYIDAQRSRDLLNIAWKDAPKNPVLQNLAKQSASYINLDNNFYPGVDVRASRDLTNYDIQTNQLDATLAHADRAIGSTLSRGARFDIDRIADGNTNAVQGFLPAPIQEDAVDIDESVFNNAATVADLNNDVSSTGDTAIYNRSKYNATQAQKSKDIRAAYNVYSAKPYFIEELHEQEYRDWWEQDQLDLYL